MGSDDLFHKRKARKAHDLARKASRRAPYDKVLIVCEGEKTEPHYFQGLINHYELNTANIVIAARGKNDPMGIVERAKQRYREDRDAGNPFDRVYCVFDKDSHTTYGPALEAIAQATPHETFFAINSVPCFEYWLLLHYNYSTKPYERLPQSSPCDQVLADLKNDWHEYAKGATDVFAARLDQLEFAKQNARRALNAAKRNHTDNPSTRIHELVDYLQHIKESP